jgi:hypothetical protein
VLREMPSSIPLLVHAPRTRFLPPVNAKFPKPVIEQYCNCYAKGMADRLSESRLQGLDGLSGAQREANVKPEVDASHLQCIRELQRAQPEPSK